MILRGLIIVVIQLLPNAVLGQFRLNDFNLNGNVQSVRIVGNKKLNATNEFLEFDSYGHLIRKISYYSNNSIERIVEYSYEWEDSVRIRKVFNYVTYPDSMDNYAAKFSYGAYNQLIKKEVSDSSEKYTLVVTYNYGTGSGEIISSRRAYYNMVTSDSTISESFYEKGNEVKVVTRFNGKLKYEAFYEYNLHGEKVKIIEYEYRGDKKVLQNSYVGGVPCFNCVYKYDRAGNWKKQYLKNNKSLVLYSKRVIKYFDSPKLARKLFPSQ